MSSARRRREKDSQVRSGYADGQIAQTDLPTPKADAQISVAMGGPRRSRDCCALAGVSPEITVVARAFWRPLASAVGLFPKGPGWAIGKWQRTAGSPRRYCPSTSGWRVHQQGAGDFTCVSYRWLRHG